MSRKHPQPLKTRKTNGKIVTYIETDKGEVIIKEPAPPSPFPPWPANVTKADEKR